MYKIRKDKEAVKSREGAQRIAPKDFLRVIRELETEINKRSLAKAQN